MRLEEGSGLVDREAEGFETSQILFSPSDAQTYDLSEVRGVTCFSD